MYNVALPKEDGVSDQPAIEMNSVFDELINAVESSAQTLTDDDNFQLAKAISAYAAGGDFYTDTGSANTYTLGVIGSKEAPNDYSEGMRIRFLAANANTSASTVNVAGLGSKSIKLNTSGTATPAGIIQAGKLTEAFYNTAGGYFVIANQYALKSDVQTSTLVKCTDTGSANTIVASVTPAITAYVSGLRVSCTIAARNTGATTANLNSIGAVNVKLANGSDLNEGELVPGMIADMYFQGTYFQLLNPFALGRQAIIGSVKHSTTTTTLPNSGVHTKLNFDTVEYDPLSMWDATNKRFVALIPGYYRITNITFNRLSTVGDGNVATWLYKGGTELKILANVEAPGDITLSGSAAIPMNAAEYVEIYGSSGAVSSNAGYDGTNESTRGVFQFEYIGAL
jgi:hypothetical protein